VQADGTANAGLYDQRFALQWMQRHASKFGGCASKVTVIGESAGAGSIMHQTTAFGGSRGPAPFQQAVIQSPAFRPVSGNNAKENIYLDLIKLLNVTSLAAKDSLLLMRQSSLQVSRNGRIKA
jgi:carboxylesterase type B